MEEKYLSIILHSYEYNMYRHIFKPPILMVCIILTFSECDLLPVVMFYSFFISLNIGTSKDIKLFSLCSFLVVKILPASFVCKVPEQFTGLQCSYMSSLSFFVLYLWFRETRGYCEDVLNNKTKERFRCHFLLHSFWGESHGFLIMLKSCHHLST